MCEPYVLSLGDSPFSPDVAPVERRRPVLEVGADVATDEAGHVIDFMAEADVEALLNDPRLPRSPSRRSTEWDLEGFAGIVHLDMSPNG